MKKDEVSELFHPPAYIKYKKLRPSQTTVASLRLFQNRFYPGEEHLRPESETQAVLQSSYLKYTNKHSGSESHLS